MSVVDRQKGGKSMCTLTGGFIRVIRAVIITITLPRFGDTFMVIAGELAVRAW